MDNLFTLLLWMASTVRELEWDNEYFEVLIETSKSVHLLRDIGDAIVELFK